MVVSKWGSGLKILLSKKKTKNKIIWCCDLLNNGETLIYNKTKKKHIIALLRVKIRFIKVNEREGEKTNTQ